MCNARPTTYLSALDVSDRAYFKKARETHDIVFSDYLFARITNKPVVMAAYPVSAIDATRIPS